MILGILASIALPSYFRWITSSHVAEAEQSMSSFKSNVDGCLDSHVTSESSCSGLVFSSSPNFTYVWLSTPKNTAMGANGLSACVTSIEASYPGAGNDLSMTRSSIGTWSFACGGIFRGFC